MGRRQTGRICPAKRETNNDVAILGNELPLPQDLPSRLNQTKKHGMKDKTRKDYQNQILRIITFWRKECHAYYHLGVIKVSKADQQDQSKYFLVVISNLI